MRKILLLLTVLASLSAQAYEPLIREDRVWEFISSNQVWDIHDHTLSTFQFDGTQEVNGKTYHQLKLKTVSSWEMEAYDIIEIGEKNTVDTVEALLREEEGVVYMLVQTPSIMVYEGPENQYFSEQPATENQEVVIYDFT